MKILAKVTKEIQQKSALCGLTDDTKANYTGSCVIAVLFKELFPEYTLTVGATQVFITVELQRYIINLPEAVSDYISEFDIHSADTVDGLIRRRLAMKEIEFEVEIPEGLIMKTGIGEVYKILSESKTLQHAELYATI